MTLEERIRDRRIGIIGMARSGTAAAFLAQRLGGKPFVSESKTAELVSTPVAQLQKAGIPFETGGHSDNLLKSDYVIISPGVPPTIDIVRKVVDKGIPIFSEIEFAYWACKGRVVAITGSNGKTTTTSLLGEVFTAAGFDTYVCGNIGFPFADIVERIPESGVAVVEVSNFQLETIADFRPTVAAILNLTPDHLDRHLTFAAYKKAKYRITENQTAADSLVLNLNDPEIMADNVATKAQKVFFTIDDRPEATAFVRSDALYYRHRDREVDIIKSGDIRIRGPHNLQNAAAAASVAAKFDIGPDILAKVLSSFAGVEHRLESVGQVGGVRFVNDSKATNVDSVCYALRSIDTPIYLIAGGRDKGAPYDPIVQWGRDKVKGVLAIGEAKEKIFSALGKAFPVQFAETLEEAVRRGFEMANPGETVLLSPGCASFDMFENYEHRGRAFKAAVAKLRNGKHKSETTLG